MSLSLIASNLAPPAQLRLSKTNWDKPAKISLSSSSPSASASESLTGKSEDQISRINTIKERIKSGFYSSHAVSADISDKLGTLLDNFT